MSKLSPDATFTIELDGQGNKPEAERVAFTYKMPSCKQYLEKSELQRRANKGGDLEVNFSDIAASTVYGLISIANLDCQVTADGLIDSLTIPEMIQLMQKSNAACWHYPIPRPTAEANSTDKPSEAVPAVDAKPRRQRISSQ